MFGRNPRIPTNLLDEPLQVTSATASLYEESLARQIAVRQAARKAVIELQDDRALRLGLQARKRSAQAYEPDARVAYWRTQKSHDGVIETRWSLVWSCDCVGVCRSKPGGYSQEADLPMCSGAGATIYGRGTGSCGHARLGFDRNQAVVGYWFIADEAIWRLSA